jgi:hypothetical protein
MTKRREEKLNDAASTPEKKTTEAQERGEEEREGTRVYGRI